MCIRDRHVPVHEISMMMSIALRFIPILLEETDKIMKAQIARGADFENGNLIQKAKNMVPDVYKRQMYDWICHNGYEPVIIATKLDKLKRSQVAKSLKEIRIGLGLSLIHI